MSALHSLSRVELRRHAWRLTLAAAFVSIALVISGGATAAPPEVHTPAEVRTTPAQFIVVAIANSVSARPGAVGGTAHGYGAGNNYRVSATATGVIRELMRKHSLTLVSEWPIEQLQMHCVLFRIPPGTTREAVIEKLRHDKRVLIAQPLNEFESATTVAAGSYDDPYATLQANVTALDVADAHRMSRGAGIRVAIIDTGVDTAHPDLAGRTHLTRNYIDNDAGLFRNDRHGTQVAGLIAAAANNGIGVVGVAPDVELMAYKACWQASASVAGRCNSFTLAQALADAITAKAQIINLSLVGPSDALLEALVAKATEAGVIVVGAASSDPRFGFPAKLPRVLAVMDSETVNDDANILRAPARDIVTLVPNGHYDFASGSSLATAQVTGVVALLLARNQKLGFERMRTLLSASTERHDTTLGPYLSVNACAALAQVVSGGSCVKQ